MTRRTAAHRRMSAASLRGLEARLIPADQREDDGMPDEELHGVVPASSDDAPVVPNGTRPSTHLDRTVSGSGMASGRSGTRWAC